MLNEKLIAAFICALSAAINATAASTSATNPTALSTMASNQYFSSDNYNKTGRWYVSGAFGKTTTGWSIKDGTGNTAKNTNSDKYQNKLNTTGDVIINAGRYLTNNVRVYGSLNLGTKNSDGSSRYVTDGLLSSTKWDDASVQNRSLSVGADYLHNIFSEKTHVFIGGNIGLNQTNSDITTNYLQTGPSTTTVQDNEGKGSNTALMYGINLGASYDFTPHFSLEAGYRYTILTNKLKVKAKPTSASTYAIEDTYKFNPSNQQMFYMAATYNF